MGAARIFSINYVRNNTYNTPSDILIIDHDTITQHFIQFTNYKLSV